METKNTPHWQDQCQHGPTRYLFSMRDVNKKWHDVYQTEELGKVEYCLRTGNKQSEYTTVRVDVLVSCFLEVHVKGTK